MADAELLARARRAQQLAELYQEINEELRLIDIIIEGEVARFFQHHRGQTPDLLAANYQGWESKIFETRPLLEKLVSGCEVAQRSWRNEYEQQRQAEMNLNPWEIE